ncbi:MAG: hypothetical protein V4662_13315 [Verrucomicrobiota bacterium]
MSAVTATFTFWLGLTPFLPEQWGILAFLVIATAGGAWYFQDQKIKGLNQQHADESAADAQAHAGALQTLKDAAADQAAEAKQKYDEACAAYHHLAAQHQEVIAAAKNREQEDAQRIAGLSAELAATREVAAQLPPTQMRVKDLDAALMSERGRVGALETALAVSTKRAGDFETRLEQTHRSLTEVRQSSEQRERELQSGLVKLEQTVRENETLVSTAEAQIHQANETLASYKQQAETRIANLQRQLAAAEAKSALVQKEFMSAVGVLPDKPAPSPRGSVAVASVEGKRISELEAKITQIEAESRKKTREDGYKIAELEFRLNEALSKGSVPPSA